MSSFRRPSWVVAAVLIVGVVGAGLFYFKRQHTADAPRYTVAAVARGDIVQAVNTLGQLSPWTSVEVSTQISGLVTDVKVDFNSKVRKGQVLAKIDPSTYEQRLRQTEADLAAAQASFMLASVNTRRLKELRAQDLVTQQEYDQSDAQRQQAEASLLTRRAAVENARVDLDRCTITSPIDGVVIFKQVEVGKTVVASFSAPTLFVIAQDLKRMRIIASVSEVDVWSIHPGQPVTFTVDAITDRVFRGRLTQIRNPYTPSDKQSQQPAGQQNPITSFDAVIEVDNSDLMLRPSLTANVSVVVRKREGVLSVPNGALRVRLPEARSAGPQQLAVAAAAPSESGNKPTAMVYRLPNGDRSATPERVLVPLGISDGMVTEVLEGLKEGDLIVTGMPSSSGPGGGGGMHQRYGFM